MEMMKCIMVRRIGSFDVTSTKIRPPAVDEVLIRVEWTGVCRTDLKLIREGHRDLVLPRIPGEEVVGSVHRTGIGVSKLKVGDTVYVYPGVWCGKCPACRSGAENLCRDMRIMGFHRDGGFAEYVTVPATSIIAVPKGLKAEHAVFAEPLSCCLNALELGAAEMGKTVAIWGAGPAGTLIFRAASALGAVPVCIEPDNRRRQRINGIKYAGDKKFDLCIVAVGSRSAYEEALTSLNPRGRLVIFSGLRPAEPSLSVDFNRLHYFEQTIVGAYGCAYRHGIRALDLIHNGRIVVEDLISHRMPLDELETALGQVEKRQCMKIILRP
jgi:L-iditol 2-dehydrogenase